MKNEKFTSRHLESSSRLFQIAFNAPPWNEAWTCETALARIKQYFECPSFVGLCALDESDTSTLKGFIAAHMEIWYDSKSCFIDEFCVHPDIQRTGIGTKLMEEFISMIKKNGIDSIYLITMHKSSGYNFYKKMGFLESDDMTLMQKMID